MKPKKPDLPHDGIEIEPDAWERFERAVDQVVKSPPQHKIKAKAPQRKSLKKRKDAF